MAQAQQGQSFLQRALDEARKTCKYNVHPHFRRDINFSFKYRGGEYSFSIPAYDCVTEFLGEPQIDLRGRHEEIDRHIIRLLDLGTKPELYDWL